MAARPDLQPLVPRIFADLPKIVAAFSTRAGGVSRSPFDGLNLGTNTADDANNPRRNRWVFLRALGFDPDRAVLAGQVHGSRVHVVDEPGVVPQCDGLVTTVKGLPLCIQTADCAAVLLSDPEAHVVGACHAGWRGAVAGIVEETVETMVRENASPDRIRAYISPCISAERFEVGPEVAEKFDADLVIAHPMTGKPHVDLRTQIRRSLRNSGLRDERIESSLACTFDDHETFYSYRRDGVMSGRMMGVIGQLT